MNFREGNTFTMMLSKGQMEDLISKKIVQFERNFFGRGPEAIKTYIFDDLVLIKLEGVLSKAERELSKDLEGILMIKNMRSKLLENCKEYIEEIIAEVMGCRVVSLHTDISTKTGERIILLKISPGSNGGT